MAHKLTIEGEGTKLERQITDVQMAKVLAVISGAEELVGDAAGGKGRSDNTAPAKRGGKQSGGRSSKGRKAESYSRVDLGLTKDQHQALAEFYRAKNPTIQNDQVAVVMYWLLTNTDRETLSRAEIFSAMRGIPGVRVPKRLTSVLSNLRLEGLVLGDGDELSLHHLGDHHVEQVLPKNGNS